MPSLLVACAIALVLGCDTTPPVNVMPDASTVHEDNMTHNDLLTTAVTYLEKNHPAWRDIEGLPYKVIEHAEYWEVTWELPDGVLGGSPVVYISKSDGTVVRAFHTQ